MMKSNKMKIATIKLTDDKDIIEVCHLFNIFGYDINCVSGEHIIDGKSMIGLLLLLNKEIDVYICDCPINTTKVLKDQLSKWII